MKIYLVIHSYDEGIQVEAFSTKAKAKAFADELMKEYREEYKGLFTTKGSPWYQADFTIRDIPDLTNGECNIEITSTEVDRP